MDPAPTRRTVGLGAFVAVTALAAVGAMPFNWHAERAVGAGLRIERGAAFGQADDVLHVDFARLLIGQPTPEQSE